MDATLDRAALQSLPDLTRKIATRFLSKFNREMYSLLCDESDPEHSKVRSAASQGLEALGYALSGALIVTFGWARGSRPSLRSSSPNAQPRPATRHFARRGRSNCSRIHRAACASSAHATPVNADDSEWT